VNERSENINKEGKNRTPVKGKRQGRLGVVEVGLGFPLVVKELSGSDGKKSGPLERSGSKLLSADFEIGY